MATKVAKNNNAVGVAKGVRKLSSGTYNVRKMVDGKTISRTFKLRRDAVAFYNSFSK
jgi:hypothetical protein